MSCQSRVLPLVRVVVSTAALDPDELSSCESYDEHFCVVFLLSFSLRPPTCFGRSEVPSPGACLIWAYWFHGWSITSPVWLLTSSIGSLVNENG